MRRKEAKEENIDKDEGGEQGGFRKSKTTHSKTKTKEDKNVNSVGIDRKLWTKSTNEKSCEGTVH